MKRMAMALCGLLLAISLSGCAGGTQHEPPAASSAVPAQSSETASTSSDESSEPVSISPAESNEPVRQESSESGDPEEASAENDASVRQIQITAADGQAVTSTLDEFIAEENTAMKLNVQIGNRTFTATLEENAAANSFAELMKTAPVVIQMSDYSGFEKVGSLGTSLPASDSQTTTQSGDIVLYNGNQIVIFYGSNSWSYTRLGKIDDLSGWAQALGNGDVTVTFSVG